MLLRNNLDDFDTSVLRQWIWIRESGSKGLSANFLQKIKEILLKKC